jgi:predicted RNase H-like HicB family nuclease
MPKGNRQERVAPGDEVPIRLRIESLEEGGHVATSPDVPGLVAEGRSVTEAVEIARGLARRIVESCLDHGDPLPPAFKKSHPVKGPQTQKAGVPPPLSRSLTSDSY